MYGYIAPGGTEGCWCADFVGCSRSRILIDAGVLAAAPSLAQRSFLSTAAPAESFHKWAERHSKPYAHAPMLLRSGSNDLKAQSLGIEYNTRRTTFLSNARFALDYNARNLGHWVG
eukprot:scaffold197045_cov21-Tisochrysis_lutea.AAC.1